jgi:hypothetical protein
MREVRLLEIEKGYNKYMEEENHMHSTQLTALAAAAMAARLLQIERECREIARRIRERERRAAMVRQDPQNMAPIMPLHVLPLCSKWVMSCSTCTKWKWSICHNNGNFLTVMGC